MNAIHAEATERERRWKAEERLEHASRQLDLATKLVGVMEQLRKAERENHSFKLQRLHRTHWVKMRRLRQGRDTSRSAMADVANKLRKERDEAQAELKELRERKRIMGPPEVAILHPDREQE